MDVRKQQVIQLTHCMLQNYYCKNNVQYIIDKMDEDILWLGTGEQEFNWGKEQVAGIFRAFEGKVPLCNITDEEYKVLEMGEGGYLCCGRLWIRTDPSTGISLRVHQRVTLGFRWTSQGLRCCHIHISNPYQEMIDDDMGFPTHMAQQSYEYLKEQVEQQRKETAEEMEFYQRLSYSDPLTGMFNRNRLNKKLDEWFQNRSVQLGVACFDLNGLKEVNDRLGHSAGDSLLCRAASHLRQTFLGRAYRTGGDEFVVLEETGDEAGFRASVAAVEKAMQEDGISCAVGVSWRDTGADMVEQFEEADRNMYQDKEDFYSFQGKDRHKR